jgi:hypothetical protein
MRYSLTINHVCRTSSTGFGGARDKRVSETLDVNSMLTRLNALEDFDVYCSPKVSELDNCGFWKCERRKDTLEYKHL